MDISFDIGLAAYAEDADDLTLSEITPSEVNERLNRCSSKYAFYASLMADAKSMQSAVDDGYDAWYSAVYAVVDESDPKRTESWKKAQVVLRNLSEYNAWAERRRKAELVVGKIKALLTGYEMQSRVLQTISANQRAEMSSLLGRSGSSPSLLDD